MNSSYTMNVLFNKQPQVLNVELAEIFGLNESIVIQQIHYWVELNKKTKKNLKDGRFWTFNTFENWQKENFSYWSVITIKRIFKKLEKNNLLLTANYNKKGFDRTKWYTIDYEKLEELIVSKKKAINLENTHSVNMIQSDEINVYQHSSNISKNPEPLENTHSINMIQSSYHIDTMHSINMIRPIPETTTETTTETKKENNYRDIHISQVKSSQVKEEKKTGQGHDLTHSTNMEISNLKQQKEIEELKQQIAKLKRDTEEITKLKRDTEEITKLKRDTEEITELNDLQKYEFYQELIKNNIDYDWICKNFKQIDNPKTDSTNSIQDYKVFKLKKEFVNLIDIFLDIMAETMSSNKKTIKINQEEIGQALVSKKFEMLTQSQLFFAVQQYQEYAKATEVKFPKKYILTCIYNATTEKTLKEYTLKF